MKDLLLGIVVMLSIVSSNFGQYTSVTYDIERNWFNEGQPLPAEKAMVFKGMMPQKAERMELNILSAKRQDLLYQASTNIQSGKEFSLPVNYKLRAADKYDFQIDFFTLFPISNRQKLENHLTATLNTYIDVNLTGDRSVKLLKKSKHITNEMNLIVADALKSYRVKIADWEPQVSEIVRLKLEQLEKADLEKSYIKGDTTTTKKAVRESTRQQLVNELKAQIGREINQLLNVEMLVVSESRIINDYETESIENGLSVNVGYGGVYLSGKLEDANYGASPYVGLAFPLGNSVLGSKFLSNSSINVGFFLNDFEDENGNKVTGFLVNRPIYVGLDHKLFKFIHLNAGAAFLERSKIDLNNPTEVSDTKVIVRPYVGLSARFNLKIGLGK